MAASSAALRKILEDVPARLASAADALSFAAPGSPGDRLLEGLISGTFDSPDGETLPGPLVAWLLAQDGTRPHLDPLGLAFRGVRFAGPLDLYGLELGVPLRLIRCKLPDGLSIGGARLKLLDLSGSEMARLDGANLTLANDLLANELRCGPVDLEDARIGGDVCFSGALLVAENQAGADTLPVPPRDGFRNPPQPEMPRDAALSLDRARIEGRAIFETVSAGSAPVKRFSARGCVYLRNTRIGGILSLNGAMLFGGQRHGRSTGALLARFCEVTGPVYLGPDGAGPDAPGFEATGRIDFSQGKLGRLFIGPYAGQGARAGTPFSATFEHAALPDYYGVNPEPAIELTGATVADEVSIVNMRAASCVLATNLCVGTNFTVEESRFGLRDNFKEHHKDGEEWALHLDGARITDSLFIRESVLNGELRLIGTELGGEIEISDSVLRCGTKGEEPGLALILRSVRVGRLWIGNRARPAEPTLLGYIYLADAHIREDLRFENVVATFEPGKLTDWPLINADGAQIGGHFEFWGCRFGTDETIMATILSANSTHVAGGVRLSRGADELSEYRGGIDLLNSEIGGNLQCRDGKFVVLSRPALNLSGTRVKGNWRCHGAHFETRSAARNYKVRVVVAEEATIGGNVSLCRKARFLGSIDLVGIRITSSLNCKGGYFRLPETLAPDLAENQRWLTESYNALNLARAQIGGDFRWQPDVDDPDAAALPPQGIVNLQGAQLGRLWDRQEWWPRKRDGEPTWHLRLDGLVYDRLHEDSVEERQKWLEWQDPKRFSLQPYEHLAPLLRRMGRHAEADEIAIGKHRAAQALRLPKVVRGLRGRLALKAARLLTVAGYCAILALLILNAAIVLAIVRRAAAPDWLLDAVRCLRGVARELYLCLAALPIEALLSWPALLVTALVVFVLWGVRHWIRAVIAVVWNWLLDTVAAHGYRPARAVLLAVYIVISGAFLFQHAYEQRRFHPVQESNFAEKQTSASLSRQLQTWIAGPPAPAPSPGPRYPSFNAVLYSLEAFVPFLSLGQSSFWALRGDAPLWLKYYKVLHTVLGWILGTVIALSPIPVFRKD